MSDPPTAPSERAFALDAQSVRAPDGTAWMLWTHPRTSDFPNGFERLDARIERGQQLTFADAQTLLASLLAALEALHQHDPRTTHGGVTPSTVYTRPDGTVALLAPDTAPFAPNTLACGAIGYFSPEFALGLSSPSDDVYAAAMTVIAASVGAHPRTLDYVNLRPQLEQHFWSAPGLFTVLTRMTEPLAAHRFRDASATLEFMRALLAGLPPSATPPAVTPTSAPRRKPRAPRVREIAPPPNDGVRLGTAQRIAHDDMTTWGWTDFSNPRFVWPASANASSTYGGGWSPSAVIGPPKVYPRHGDIQGAWAPKSTRMGVQWLDVTFPEDAPEAAVMLVFETHNPGAVYCAQVLGGADDGALLWKAPAVLSPDSPRVLMIEFDAARSVPGVRLWLDTNISSGWTEIDTVALVIGRETAMR